VIHKEITKFKSFVSPLKLCLF